MLRVLRTVCGSNEDGVHIDIDLGKQNIVNSLYWKSIALPELEGIKVKENDR